MRSCWSLAETAQCVVQRQQAIERVGKVDAYDRKHGVRHETDHAGDQRVACAFDWSDSSDRAGIKGGIAMSVPRLKSR
jgi:hypothetical protein